MLIIKSSPPKKKFWDIFHIVLQWSPIACVINDQQFALYLIPFFLFWPSPYSDLLWITFKYKLHTQILISVSSSEKIQPNMRCVRVYMYELEKYLFIPFNRFMFTHFPVVGYFPIRAGGCKPSQHFTTVAINLMILNTWKFISDLGYSTRIKNRYCICLTWWQSSHYKISCSNAAYSSRDPNISECGSWVPKAPLEWAE